MRALILIVFLGGCFADMRFGASGPVGSKSGGTGPDVEFGVGGEHRGKRIRAGGGLHLGAHLADGKEFAPLGVMGRVDVGLTTPNDRGGRLIATAQASMGIARGFPGTDGNSLDGTYAQMFLGLGFGGTSCNEPQKVEGDHVALGVLATRCSPSNGDGYWLLGGALSFSFGLNLSKVSEAFSEKD